MYIYNLKKKWTIEVGIIEHYTRTNVGPFKIIRNTVKPHLNSVQNFINAKQPSSEKYVTLVFLKCAY